MGGLQGKLVERSKAVLGHGSVVLQSGDAAEVKAVTEILQDVPNSREIQVELLGKYRGRIAPVIAHGVDWSSFKPAFARGEDISEAMIGRDMAFKLRLSEGDRLELISGAHVDSLLGDVPRFISVDVQDVIASDVADVDMFHLWLPLAKVQNLIRKRTVERVRYYGELNSNQLQKLRALNVRLVSWEEGHSTLVWALKLESSVMLFLFFGMTLLVSLCITSGLLLFFGKIKLDLTSFWILGFSGQQIKSLQAKLSYSLVITSVLTGLLLGLGFLALFDSFGGEILPDIFVDRKIPIAVTVRGLLFSIFIPLTIGLVFARFSLSAGEREEDYLTLIRSNN